MRFLLDTNICIYSLKRHPPEVLERLRRVGPGAVTISVITLLELRQGAENSQHREKSHAKLDLFLAPLPVVSFDRQAARLGARIRARLRRLGTPIGDFDSLIAAHAMALDLTLVSNNLSEFRRVEGLRYENWVSNEEP